MADKIERANADIERVDPSIFVQPRKVQRAQTRYSEDSELEKILLETIGDDPDYIKGTDVDDEAQRPSLYDLWEQRKEKPDDVDEDTWKQVGDRFHQCMALVNTPPEFFPGYEERMEILSGDSDYENDEEIDEVSYLEVDIPESLARDYDFDALQDLGILVENGKASILVDAQGSPLFPDGPESYTGRFIRDLQAANKPAFEANAHALREAHTFEETLLEIGALGMMMRPQKAEDGSMELMVDYRSDSPGFERGDAETPASANIVGSLPEALATAKDMAAQRDKVLTSIAEAQVADTSVQKTYVVLSADEMQQAVAAAKGEGVATARTIESNDVSISITDDGIVATSCGHTMRAVKEDSGAHLAEVKAEFADQDITIHKVAATGEYRVDFRKDTFGFQAGEDGSAGFHDGLNDAALGAKARVEWRAAHQQKQSETKVATDEDDKQRLRLVAS
ncbi:hypothetical protein [Pseudorhizobium flavum]|uniref:hypothetical protein n=1 Tax=Pseudorhizobium flavum TaxID=1335061 RepID=UPI0037706459